MEKKIWQAEYWQTDQIEDLSTEDRKLLDAAREAAKGSHAPYSRFHVGAALLLDDGQVIHGSNQENASFPLGLCAERTAISAKASIAPDKSILAIGITVSSELKLVASPAAPCGICRQVLLESEATQSSSIRVILQGESGPVIVFKSIQDLLPFHFSSGDF